MRIAIDCRFAGGATGLGRYTRELVTHVLRRDDPAEYVLIVRSDAEQWISGMHDRAEIVAADIPHYSIAEQTALPRLIRRCRPDLYFAPHFNVPLFLPVPFVATVHDLILHRYPNAAPAHRRWAYRAMMRGTVRRATAIIAVSGFTALELGGIYGTRVLPKITVIPEASGPEFEPADPIAVDRVRRSYGVRGPYFLYIGNAKQHKNLPMLLEAFRTSSRVDRTLVLVTGGREADALRLPERSVLLRDVPDADLAALLTGAECFVSPSLYEGFGLPMLEALRCGCPVIAVNRTAVRELLRGYATLVEPTMDALRSALADPPKRPVRVPEGCTWEEAAKRTVEVLRSHGQERGC